MNNYCQWYIDSFFILLKQQLTHKQMYYILFYEILNNDLGGAMNIVKFTKKKSDQYLISLDNGTDLLLHEDLILKHELLIKRKISNQDIDDLTNENNKYVYYDSAIKYLSKKMRCKLEVKKFLIEKGLQEFEVEEIINKLIMQGYIDDKAYASAYINDRINLSNDGPYKIIDNLKKYEIKEEIIKNSMLIYTDDMQTERVKKLVNKCVKSNNNKSKMVLKNKIYMNLISLGYNKSIISNILNNVQIDDYDIYEKECSKLREKLSKKYSGKVLDYKVKEKLYQKGFTNFN